MNGTKRKLKTDKDKIKKQITVFSGSVVKDGKILMVLRDEEECPDAHLKWEFPGGKVDFEETPRESVAREIFEETGVRVTVKNLLPFIQTNYWKYEWGTQQTLCFVFLCHFLSSTTPSHDHHMRQIKWVDIDKIKELRSLPGTNEIVYAARKILKIN